MKRLQGPLYISRDCDCFGQSWPDEQLENDSTRSWSWEPKERNEGLYGRSVCWSGEWTVSDIFTGIDQLFTAMDLDWIAEQRDQLLS